MIAVRRVEERPRRKRSQRPSARSDATYWSELGPLRALADLWLSPGEHAELQVGADAEVITYVTTGTIVLSMRGRTTALLSAGELLVAGGRSLRQANAGEEPAHVVSLRLRLSKPGRPAAPLQHFVTVAQRRGGWCAIAAGDGREGALRLQSDAVLWSAVLEPGQHLVHGLAPERTGLLHVVSGEAQVGGYILSAGDTAHAVGERALSLTALRASEVLLCDI